MSATMDAMTEEKLVTVTIDGRELKARPGAMLIEVADEAGITIPRFCYHEKLSIAANCRMCLVEVVKAPKPLPACATPVSDGMQVFTQSPTAIAAQRGTMEFLLINHPLDCPICDQGGECDLQEISIGYGECHSEYSEPKRVVPDKDIGPLIATEMTRCIHCTRCVRFGDEIAGLRELGATGRGERMRIGTYIEKAVTSELSGNVIDLCPVGALTSKPFRFTARAWEMNHHDGIAAHDCVGSNIDIRVRGKEVMRIDPRDNEAINECWLADRDRFSYEGLHRNRLVEPMIKRDGQWQTCDWQMALNRAVEGLRQVIGEHGGDAIKALVSPNATTEEMFLTQKLVRGLGSTHIDHRLRHLDTSGQDEIGLYPALGRPIASLAGVDAALLIGSHCRKDQPIVSHRLRQAALKGGRISFVNGIDYAFNFPVHEAIVTGPIDIERQLAGIAKALMPARSKSEPYEGLSALLKGRRPTAAQKRIAESLAEADDVAVILGLEAQMHPSAGRIQALARAIATLSGATVGFLTDGANSAGGWISGTVPHRLPAGGRVRQPGQSVAQMFGGGPAAYLMLGIEPDYDLAMPGLARRALAEAEFVVGLSAFDSPALREQCDVLLPVATFTETSGTFVNCEGQWQGFAAAVPAPGQARPAWKVLRVLGNLFSLAGFEQMSSEDALTELRQQLEIQADALELGWHCPEPAPTPADSALWRIADVPPLAVDAIVRRADSLQQTADSVARASLHVHPAQARALGIVAGDRARVTQDEGFSAELDVVLDERIPEGSVYIPTAVPGNEGLGPAIGPVKIEALGHS